MLFSSLTTPLSGTVILQPRHYSSLTPPLRIGCSLENSYFSESSSPNIFSCYLGVGWGMNGGVGSRGVGFALELHSDLDEVKRVGGASCNHESYTSLNKTFDAHIELIFSRTKQS